MTVESKAKSRPSSNDLCLVSRAKLQRLRHNLRLPAKPLIVLWTGIRLGGIGQAGVARLARLGHTVIAVDNNRALGVEAVRQVRADTGSRKVFFVHANVADEDDVRRLMACIRARLGRLDTVVNNAGTAGPDPRTDSFHGQDGAHARWLLENNLLSAFLVSKYALEEFLIPQGEGGRILFLGSTQGRAGFGNAGQALYSASKEGIRSLVRSGVAFYSRFGVTMNIIIPGLVLTKSENWQHRLATDRDYDKKEAEKIPAGRLATPDDIASAVVVLLSPETAYWNGLELTVDGGLTAAGACIPNVVPGDRDSFVALVDHVRGKRRLRTA